MQKKRLTILLNGLLVLSLLLPSLPAQAGTSTPEPTPTQTVEASPTSAPLLTPSPEPSSTPEPIPPTFKFTGQRQESSFGLYLFGSRWYDPYLNRWTSPDSIIPRETGNYSPLTVDYHETPYLDQLNQENRTCLDDPQTKPSTVPTNPLAFDRYSYVFNNPLKYTDPTGRCIWDLCIFEIAGVSLGLAELSVIVGGGGAALALSTPQGREAATQALAEGLEWASEQVSIGLNALFAKGEYIPPGLSGAERHAYREAVHAYKRVWGLGGKDNVPKKILDDIADAIKEGLKPGDAVDAVDGPSEADSGD